MTIRSVSHPWSHHALVLVLRVAVLLAAGALWETAARTGLLPAAFVGQPTAFLAMLWGMIVDGSVLTPISDTLSATALAFIIGGVLALASALLLTLFPLAREVLQPFLDALNALPRVALVPLFIVWFGLGMTSKGCAVSIYIRNSWTVVPEQLCA